jgi:hypothetical protein
LADLLDYDQAGAFRRELAQKIIAAQITLARGGFSTGGRAPYGFQRWIATADGNPVRQLADGEYVKRAGHHVVWLPGPDQAWDIIHRILRMLETMPASRVAARLTAEGVPPPDFGRRRTDRGVEHTTSGVWHATTVANIARNPLIVATVSYGRRSMGDQLRFTPNGPRALAEADFSPDGKPRVVINPVAQRIETPAKYESPIDPVRHRRLIQELDRRGGTQRGKPRSCDEAMNPLGARAYDMNCGWPLYRQPSGRSYRYLCGLYQQSHGARCTHNHVDGPRAVSFLLDAVRQRILHADVRSRLERKVRDLVQTRDVASETVQRIPAMRASLARLDHELELVAKNMALAESDAQRQATATVFDQLHRERERLVASIDDAGDAREPSDPEAEVAASLSLLDRLAQMASEPLAARLIGELFAIVNARIFLRFRAETWGKRRVNRVAGGVVTFGAAPPPVELYDGPTSRRHLQKLTATPNVGVDGAGIVKSPVRSVREMGSLGNANRGERN